MESERVKQALDTAHAFVADELDTRKASFLPGPEEDEQNYISSAANALALIDAALRELEAEPPVVKESLTTQQPCECPRTAALLVFAERYGEDSRIACKSLFSPCPVQAELTRLRAELAGAREAEKQQRRGIYVASRASVPERGAMWRRLRATGMHITSSWIDEDGPGQTADMSELWARIESEISRSAALILYVEASDFPLKGALVEVGMALALGMPVVVVSPGVEVDPHSCRPIGSWMRHPNVIAGASIEEAIAAVAPEEAPRV